MASSEGSNSAKSEERGSPAPSLGDEVTRADAGDTLPDATPAVVGEAVSAPQADDLPNRYQILATIGRGGMGEVAKAIDTRLKRTVAIKRVHGNLAKSPKALQRFLVEAQSIAQLNHPNVVQVYDHGSDERGPFLVLEFVDGQSLAERLAQGKLPLKAALQILLPICDALQAAHHRGIVHRDVKPANILLTSGGTPKLTDFGLARQVAADSGHTQAGISLGTPDFMAPEQRQDAAQADARSDQWSLAATLYQMLTGEAPRVITSEAIPREVRLPLLRALKSQPLERFASIREFAAALRQAFQIQSSAAARVPPGPQPRQDAALQPRDPPASDSGSPPAGSLVPARKSRLKFVAAVVMVGGLIAAGVFVVPSLLNTANTASTGSTSSTTEATTPAANPREISLLPLVQISRDQRIGTWLIPQPGQLQGFATKDQRVFGLVLPYDPPEEYRLRFRVTRQSREPAELTIGLAFGKYRFNVRVDANRGGKTYTGLINPLGNQQRGSVDMSRVRPGTLLPARTPMELAISVRKRGVFIFANRERVVHWEGDYAELSRAVRESSAPLQIGGFAPGNFLFSDVFLEPLGD